MAQILRANIFTRVNAILGVLCAIVLSTGSVINAAFGLLIIANSAVGVVQELRAKKTLDKLRIVGESEPTVIRDGGEKTIPQHEVVLGDIIKLRSGDEVVVDGTVVAGSLRVDESQLTGEADAVSKGEGDEILSGAFVNEGSAVFRADKVGDEAYAARLASQASEFSLTDSVLMNGINSILKVITWLLIPTGILTIWTQLVRSDTGLRESILSMAAAIVPMVPEGLVLMTSIAFAAGVIRLGKYKALVNELVAIEGLARVDTVCTDKTGTLTTNEMELDSIVAADGSEADAAWARNLASMLNAQDDLNDTARSIVAGLRAVWSPTSGRATRFPLTRATSSPGSPALTPPLGSWAPPMCFCAKVAAAQKRPQIPPSSWAIRGCASSCSASSKAPMVPVAMPGPTRRTSAWIPPRS